MGRFGEFSQLSSEVLQGCRYLIFCIACEPMSVAEVLDFDEGDNMGVVFVRSVAEIRRGEISL